MSLPIKHLSDLAALRSELEQAAVDRARREREAAEAAENARRDANLFRDAIGDVAPLKRHARADHALPRPAPIAHQHRRDEASALAASLSDELGGEMLLEADENLSWRREGIGPDVVRKLRRSHWIIDAELDLHGARREQARELVSEFLRDAIKRHWRCVRVIHGKGLGSIGKQPVLKGKVRTWLMQKDEVLAFCQAREQDGGSGALIVLLRPG